MRKYIKRKIWGLTAICMLLVASPLMADVETTNAASGLDSRQKSIVEISAFTATGQIDHLKHALNNALDAGMAKNEIEEVLVHVYAYAGFPRSFNGMMAFMGVMDERKARGIIDEIGKEASPIPAALNRDEYGARVRAQLGGLDDVPPPAKWQEFSPVIDKFLKEHLFADLFVRDILSFSDRELATVAVLASLPGLEGPLGFHLGAAMNTGLSEQQMYDFIKVLDRVVEQGQVDSANAVLKQVLSRR